ncbi:MAG: peptidyl-prolyl cis-trans isomerase [Verrucomicrobiales bacterium]|nr:peptidyl-prolyl cis-trans isomerase [Verrucomicrobiales bacterium]
MEVKLFQQPEMVRVKHILISILDPNTNKELSGEQKLQKRELAEKLLARAKAGEDFAKLVKEFSEDKNAKDRDGEYTIMRNDRRYVLPPEFEGAAFSMATNQISDIVLTPYGYHIIKGLERIPAKKSEYAQVEGRIKENLQQEAVQKELPNYIATLRKEAGVELLKREEQK